MVQFLRMMVMCAMIAGSFCYILGERGIAAGKEGAAPKVLILAGGHSREGKLILLSQLARQAGGISITYSYEKKRDAGVPPAAFLAPYDLVIFDGLSGEAALKTFADYADAIPRDKRFISIRDTTEGPLTHGWAEPEIRAVNGYYTQGGRANLTHLVAYLKAALTGRSPANIPAPIHFPAAGVYHPDYEKLVFEDVASYLAWRGHRPGQAVIGLSLPREAIAAADTAIEDHFIRAIEAAGALAVPYYFSAYAPDAQLRLLQVDGKGIVDSIINMNAIHMASARRADYEAMNVPILQTIPYMDGGQADWEASDVGISPMLTPFYLTLSETAGTTDLTVVSALGDQKKRQPIPYQVAMVVEKALRISALKHKQNADKKLAIMFYNYPPGEKNAGASFLNIPLSLESITSNLRQAGYQAPAQTEQWYIDQVATMLRPFYRDLPYTDIPGLGQESGAGDMLPLTVYRDWYDQLPAALRASIEKTWGPPEDAFSIVTKAGVKYFAVPRVRAGNIMILPQPPRGNRKDDEGRIFHDQAVPVSHNYLAVYFYVREIFGADALVHLGTHGSQEYMPGKDRGLSRYDAGNLALGDLPVIYPFIMDDVGEALQTKRRGRATVISHLTPPLVKSGLYQEMTDLHDLMHQYKSLGDGAVKDATREQIITLVQDRNIHQDVGWSVADITTRFTEFSAVLHDYIGELGTEVQPLGLHTFGTIPQRDHLTSTLVQMLGQDFAELARDRGAAYLPPHPQAVPDAESEPQFAGFESLSLSPEFRLIDRYVMGAGKLDEDADPDLKDYLQQAREHYANFKGTLEHRSMLDALDGKFITPSVGGDPLRTPEALPSGRNLYGFDPSKLPTRAAWDAGKDLTEKLIADFHAEHGRFPDKLAFSLWSIEAMRHLGVVESQVMYAMGVRPVWDEGGYVRGTEVIPYSELKRPRADVVISATGLYRDALPNVMLLLAQAVDQVAALGEDNNYLAANARTIKTDLLAEGFTEEEATTLSTVRIFSNQSGQYGTGVSGVALESGSWDTDAGMAKLYLDRVGYGFGSDSSLWGRKFPKADLYARSLSGTDAAIFARSSNVYGLLTSDDPYQYMGGLSLAVRALDGKSPEMFVSNLRDRDHVKTETLGKFLAKELRSRYFHPQWIQAMQDEGYAGATALVDVTNNLWGWQVVDPDNVRDDQWQEFFEVYVADKYDMNMRDWFEQANPHALAQMIERMLEAHRKGYWQTDEATVKKLVETYSELARTFDVVTSNQKFNEFVAAQAAGFGLAPILSPTRPDAAAAAPAPLQQVEGQKLEKQSHQTSGEEDLRYLLLILVIAAAFAGGFARQMRRG